MPQQIALTAAATGCGGTKRFIRRLRQAACQERELLTGCDVGADGPPERPSLRRPAPRRRRRRGVASIV